MYHLSEDESHELFIVDVAVPVNVCLGDHLLGLLHGEDLADAEHDGGQLRARDEAVALLVEHAEGLPDLLLDVRVVELPGDSQQSQHTILHP